jgi:hypothetical protein
MCDDYTIVSVEELESVIGEPLDFLQQKVRATLDESMREFIRRAPLVFLSTVDAKGTVDTSPKGDAAGFVQCDEQGSLLIPDRPGNKLVYGFRNILENSNVGLIFVVPTMRETLRVKGKARITNDPALLETLSAKGKPALLCTQVDVQECFFHCGKAMIRSGMWKPDEWAQYHDGLMVKQLATVLGDDEALVPVLAEEIEKNYRDELY